ncbi:alpha/beta fold hydrolase [Paraburkholderia mimosarum]|uniref:alpha/beta fold hydrolase n=1 Tax=Paraburkholderia mimosarum TaxID=312026 RepID=UPI00040C2B12|nr:alpha/beta hydrolase [Paraburkholderia mimosarum]
MERSFKQTVKSSRTEGLAVAAAGAAAAAALWVRHRARRAERDNPPVGRFIDVDGVRLHYVEQGEGPAVVLLHGNTVPLQDFISSGLIGGLAARHRVIAFDRPGFGYSERPRRRLWTAQAQARTIRSALNQLGVAAPVVLGHSWGALVALEMAIDAESDVNGLVLVSGYYYPSARLDVAFAAPAALPLVGDVLRYTVSPLIARLLLERTVATMFAPTPVPDSFFDAIAKEMITRPSQIRAVAEDAATMVPAAARLSHRYAALSMPVRIFAGAQDRIVAPQAHSVRLHDALTHSSLVVVPGAGHMVHYAVAPEIIAAIDAMSAAPRLQTGTDHSAIADKPTQPEAVR